MSFTSSYFLYEAQNKNRANETQVINGHHSSIQHIQLRAYCVSQTVHMQAHAICRIRGVGTQWRISPVPALIGHILGSVEGPINLAERWSLQGLEPVCALVNCITSVGHWALEDQVGKWMA